MKRVFWLILGLLLASGIIYAQSTIKLGGSGKSTAYAIKNTETCPSSDADDCIPTWSNITNPCTDIIPCLNLTYNVGSDTYRWAEAFVGPGSLHIGRAGDDVSLQYQSTVDRWIADEPFFFTTTSGIFFGNSIDGANGGSLGFKGGNHGAVGFTYDMNRPGDLVTFNTTNYETLIYDQVQNTDPMLAIGTTTDDNFAIQVIEAPTSTQVDHVVIGTNTQHASANMGAWSLMVDSVIVGALKDNGLVMWEGASVDTLTANTVNAVGNLVVGRDGIFTGDVAGVKGTFSGALSGNTVSGGNAVFTGDVSGVDGTFTGEVSGNTTSGVNASFTGDVVSDDIRPTGEVVAGTSLEGVNAVLSGDAILYQAINDGNPEIKIGSADAEELHIQSVYDTGAQTLDYILLQTDAASVAADKGQYKFNVDGTEIVNIDDNGIEVVGDATLYEATNDASPEVRVGSADAEEAHIQAVYDAGAQTLNYVQFETDLASAVADKGQYKFNVDGTLILSIDDGGVEIIGGADSTNDMHITDAVNDGNPEFRMGSADTEETHIQTMYDAGAQTLDYVLFQTDVASVAANKGQFKFNVDGTEICRIDDNGIEVVGGVDSTTDIRITEALNDGSPEFRLGSADTEEAHMQAVYDAGAQTLDYVQFQTDTASVAADKGQYKFSVDGTEIVNIDDDGLEIVGDATLYEAVNDANPEVRMGSADTEEVHMQIVYDAGAQTVDYVQFQTDVASAVADKGQYKFSVDGTEVVNIDDNGLEIVGDATLYETVNDANPEVRMGSADAEEGHVQIIYDAGAQTLDYMLLQTDAASAAADKGQFKFNVDGTEIFRVDDNGTETVGDATLYEAVNDANPEVRIGSADAEEGHMQAVYDGGAQTLNYVLFQTDVASAIADKGMFKFNVDGTDICQIDDDGIQCAADATLYQAVNDANPELRIGSADAEELHIQTIYAAGAQTIDYVKFNTDEAGAAADAGQYKFFVDGIEIAAIDDSGFETTGMDASGAATVGGTLTVTGAGTFATDVTISPASGNGDLAAQSELSGLVRAVPVILGTGVDGTTYKLLIDDSPVGEYAQVTVGVPPTITTSVTHYRVGAASLGLAWPAGAVDGDGAVDADLFAGGDLENHESLGMWFYADETFADGDFEAVILDNGGAQTFNIPAYTVANTWQWIEVDISALNAGTGDVCSDFSILMSAAGAIAHGAFNMWVDTGYAWDAATEEALGRAIILDGVSGGIAVADAAVSTNTPIALTLNTDYFIHYETGNDFIVWMTNQAANSGWVMVNY